ncbi:hypothetical protein [Peribacillus loiseleuriae]|uniref:Uncharacterized protein n=1 Tax=Peribacillus loiseleuriae TaxID=1679170 RepID=A0A0K9GQZ3_9BACI|nr:hypothetical protein [Peribacillus loiseleuriae]KMY49119.1 hypothetical protein AC625_05965 [Peribacillus loiseleuriae]
MGYIIPITQFEYLQYANRTVAAAKCSVKSIGGISSIFPLPLFQHLNQDKDKQIENIITSKSETKKALINPQNSSSYKMQVPEYVVEQIIADLTGKGGFFNQRI